MKKKYILLLLLLLLAGAGFYFWPSDPEEDFAHETLAEHEDAAAAMSIRGMEIRQGEEGHELWRLKAEGAVMSQQGGEILAKKPFLTYYIKGVEGDDTSNVSILTVESESGDVDQKDDRIRFVGDVQVRHEDDILDTALIIYEGNKNHLKCPEPSVLTRPGMRGLATEVVWDLEENILRATNGVDIDLETDRAPGKPLLSGASDGK